MPAIEVDALVTTVGYSDVTDVEVNASISGQGGVLEGTGSITDVYEKERSNGGKLEFYVTETEWKDAETGDPVCTTTFTLVINVSPPKPEA